jgi:hypothetical protein
MPAVAPLRTVASHALTAVYASVAARELSPDQLWHYEQVVEALMEDRDLLPLRFGTWLDDEHAVARALEERHRDLARALDNVRGAVELSVRVLDGQPQASPADAADTGAGYLRAKAQTAAAQARAVRAVHEPLARLARATAQKSGRGREVMRAAYLVDRSAVERFVECVAGLERSNPDLRLLCTGPWPPYSFSER